MGHHRRTLERGAKGVLEGGQAPLKVGPIHVPLRVSSAGFAIQEAERAVPRQLYSYSAPTWGGRPISKWCRYGMWSEDGSTLTTTRVL